MRRLTLGALLAALLPRSASSFQFHSRGPSVSRSTRPRSRTMAAATGRLASLGDDDMDARPAPPAVLLSAAVALSCLCGGAAPATADEASDRASKIFNELTRIRIDENDTDRQTEGALGKGIGDYFNKATARPDYGAVPEPILDTDDRATRLRKYDEAFQADARARDAYYGSMAMANREKRAEDVGENRRSLGLDGPGDVRPRVGDEVVAGTASLRQYLLEQDPSTLTPSELKVYNQMKERGSSEKVTSGEEL